MTKSEKIAAGIVKSLAKTKVDGWRADPRNIDGTPCIYVTSPRLAVLVSIWDGDNATVTVAAKKVRASFAAALRTMADKLDQE